MASEVGNFCCCCCCCFSFVWGLGVLWVGVFVLAGDEGILDQQARMTPALGIGQKVSTSFCNARFWFQMSLEDEMMKSRHSLFGSRADRFLPSCCRGDEDDEGAARTPTPISLCVCASMLERNTEDVSMFVFRLSCSNSKSVQSRQPANT